MPVSQPFVPTPYKPWGRPGRLLAGLLLLLGLAGCAPPDRAGAAILSPVLTQLPPPAPTVSGAYDNPVAHTDGHYRLQRDGTQVEATLTVSRSPVEYWAREVAAPLFTIPKPFRPPFPVLRTAEGLPVRADGTPDPDHPELRLFLLRVDPEGAVHYVHTHAMQRKILLRVDGAVYYRGAVHYVDDDHVEGVEHLAYTLDTVWGTTAAANDRGVLKILDRHWFRQTVLSAVPPPEQFEVPEHTEHMRGTFPAARVGAFVTFDADGRVTALGAPTHRHKASAGAPTYRFRGPLLAELGQLHHLEHLDLGYRTSPEIDVRNSYSWKFLYGTIPPQLWRLSRLRHLDLQGQRMGGPLPSDMGRLASLEYLDLGHNRLSGPLPPELGRLASLKHLDLGGNDFTEPLPSELGQLARLRWLDLSHNRLTDLPSALEQLANLEHLNLGGNWFTGPLPSEWSQLARLRWLDLSHNRLMGSLPPEWGQLNSLQTLHLQNNRLTDLPPEWSQLASLQTLHLQNNRLTGSLPPEWGQLNSLQVLDLNGNQLTGPLPPEWDQLDSLRWLYLHDNQLTGSLPPEWGQLDSLQRLYLHDNQLTGSLPPEWGQLVNWLALCLAHNRLTGSLPPEWGQLRLESLCLQGNRLTGPLPPEWGRLLPTIWLDLRDNQLTGCFPREVPVMEGAANLHDLPNCPLPVRDRG